jgi:hypothetical protein
LRGLVESLYSPFFPLYRYLPKSHCAKGGQNQNDQYGQIFHRACRVRESPYVTASDVCGASIFEIDGSHSFLSNSYSITIGSTGIEDTESQSRTAVERAPSNLDDRPIFKPFDCMRRHPFIAPETCK